MKWFDRVSLTVLPRSENPFGILEGDDRRFALGIWTSLDQPVCQPSHIPSVRSPSCDQDPWWAPAEASTHPDSGWRRRRSMNPCLVDEEHLGGFHRSASAG